MIDAILQYVIALSSALTAATLVYIAREAHEARRTINENEQRSMVNRAVLEREGIYRPIPPRSSTGERDG